jgi:hypothetical protein
MNQILCQTKSSFGNKFSTFWFWAETGISKKYLTPNLDIDLYPVALMQK